LSSFALRRSHVELIASAERVEHRLLLFAVLELGINSCSDNESANTGRDRPSSNESRVLCLRFCPVQIVFHCTIGLSFIDLRTYMLSTRKDFLRLLGVGAALQPARTSAQQTATSVSGKQPFVARVTEDCAAALRCALCNIGDRLGLFRAMADSRPVTVAELSRKTQLNVRILREWLNAMVAASYIEYRPRDKTYILPSEHALVLANEETSPVFIGGAFQLYGGMVAATPKVASTFQTGKPVSMSDFPEDVFVGTDRVTAPRYKHDLVQKWIPLLPQVQEKLMAGGAAVDVGCGTGLASIMLAKAFPKSQFVGYDPYAPSIRKARERARSEGLSDRVQFVAADNSKLPAKRFDLLTVFISVHHFSDPVKDLRYCREALKPGATCFIYDADLSLNPEDNMNTVGQLAYAGSTLFCLHSSMANNGAAFGAEFNEQVLRNVAQQSGFTECKKLLGTPGGGAAFYQLRA
jgi:ubiquinone/menaquinone biosynthesis C-methylase UbiE